MARKGENIYLRKDGRYEGRFIKSKDADGKAVYGYVYSRKYAECKNRLIQAKNEVQQVVPNCKQYKDGSMREFIPYWLDHIVSPLIKHSTKCNYAAISKKYIIPQLGVYLVSRLNEEQVQKFIHALSHSGLSNGTVRNVFRVLYAIMNKAAQFEYSKHNPCLDVELPSYQPKEIQVLSGNEQSQLESYICNDIESLPILLALYTGLRIGEICALTWSNIDFETGTLRVCATRRRVNALQPDQRRKTTVMDGTAKTQTSCRTIPLLSVLSVRLKALQKNANSAYVFTYKDKPLEPRVLQYRLKRKLEEAEIRRLHFHALRHTFATRCLEQNMDVKTLSELLGHTNVSLTLNKYGHSRMEHKRMALQTLETRFHQSA